MQLKIAQVVGLNTDQKAAQAISSQREDNAFLAVLDLSCDDAFTKGRQILSDLSDFYFDSESTPADRLKATFEQGQKKLEGDLIGVLIAAISGKILYFITEGAVEIYLKRTGKLSPLASAESQKQLISGFIQEGDRLLFSTSSLTQFLADDLDKSLNLSTQQFEEEITDRIGASDLANKGLAALSVEVAAAEVANILPLPEEPSNIYLTNDADLELPVKKNLTKFLNFVWQKKAVLLVSGKNRLIIAFCLIMIIVLGAGFKIKAQQDAQKQIVFTQALKEAKDDFNGAKGLASLNPAEAKTKLDSSKDKINKALRLKPNDAEAKAFKDQIEAESASILLQTNVSEFPLFLDLDLVKKNFRAAQMSLSNGKLLLLDPAVKTLVVIDLAKKSNQILAGSDQLGAASFASLNGGLAFVYSKDKGVLRVDIQTQKLTTVSKKEADLGEIQNLYGFAGNIYLLDIGNPPEGGMIWKYLAITSGYSDKREYLNKAVKADFADVVRMQIESSIYVLKKGGEMLRFTRGDKDNFSYGGLPSGVKDPKSFFVSSDTDNLYLLDSGNSRLLILTKTGSYKGQVSGSEFTQATDLVVDEKGKKVYLLDGSKIYMVDLK